MTSNSSGWSEEQHTWEEAQLVCEELAYPKSAAQLDYLVRRLRDRPWPHNPNILKIACDCIRAHRGPVFPDIDELFAALEFVERVIEFNQNGIDVERECANPTDHYGEIDSGIGRLIDKQAWAAFARSTAAAWAITREPPSSEFAARKLARIGKHLIASARDLRT